MHRKRKDIVKIVSREQLRLNRIEHDKAQREAIDKPCDVENMDEDGNKYYHVGSLACGGGASQQEHATIASQEMDMRQLQ